MSPWSEVYTTIVFSSSFSSRSLAISSPNARSRLVHMAMWPWYIVRTCGVSLTFGRSVSLAGS